ncbi:NADH-quinone oxidoreductase subunit C [Ornithinimicrobium ciconiae]|uniref:NADH-quinone oxidoreductase subunit C n=1 Tax=Ornithinimicrobium ciconiae TaxID=2594265 RepID=A0A516G895_9MICO|nr:NADH-quinone oxidoreductase subunit C [Ornithinimicrobium ciconiae]QDO87741.1 NADH-quinone oxidoreductase subunit C [Ornithinimicrobium ciconiae]
MITWDVTVEEWTQQVRAAHAEGFDFFDWLSAVDQLDAEADPGLDVLCHLIRTDPWERVLLRTRVPVGTSLGSVTEVFRGAAWHERETHEMFGIDFAGFDDGTSAGLRPLLLPNGFEGNPLRKSFHLTARASKPWPGAKEPGEGGEAAAERPARPGRDGETPAPRKRARRRLLPPGVPDESWGPR